MYAYTARALTAYQCGAHSSSPECQTLAYLMFKAQLRPIIVEDY